MTSSNYTKSACSINRGSLIRQLGMVVAEERLEALGNGTVKDAESWDLSDCTVRMMDCTVCSHELKCPQKCCSMKMARKNNYEG